MFRFLKSMQNTTAIISNLFLLKIKNYPKTSQSVTSICWILLYSPESRTQPKQRTTHLSSWPKYLNKGNCEELDRLLGRKKQKCLLLLQWPEIFFLVSLSVGSQWPVTPVPMDLKPSSGLLGHPHTCIPECENTHIHTTINKVAFTIKW